jgi:hypothetical protein
MVLIVDPERAGAVRAVLEQSGEQVIDLGTLSTRAQGPIAFRGKLDLGDPT